MNNIKKSIGALSFTIKDYINLRSDLISINAADKASTILSTLITKGALFVLFLLGFVFFTIALALYISNAQSNAFVGFLWIGGGYALLGILLVIIKDSWLKKPILNSFIAQFFDSKESRFQFTSIEDLHAELTALKIEKKVLEQKIEAEFNFVQESFGPKQIITDGISSMINKSNKNVVLDKGLGLGVDFIANTLLFRKRPTLFTFLLSTAIKGLSKKVIGKKVDSLLARDEVKPN